MRPAHILAASVAVLLVAAAPSRADSTWTNGGGDQSWTNTDNWDGGVVPSIEVDTYTYINLSGTDASIISSDVPVIPHLRIGDTRSVAGNLPADVTDGTLWVTAGDVVSIGDSAIGMYNATGYLNVASNAAAGGIAGPAGQYTGMTLGAGSLSITDGTIQIGAYGPGGQGAGGTGEININTTGTLHLTSANNGISFGDGGTARINLDNGTLQTSGTAFVLGGSDGTATMQMSGGSLKADNGLAIGAGISNGGGSGSMTMSGGTVTTTFIAVGTSGNGSGATGSWTISGGIINAAADFVIADTAGSNGVVTQTGGDLNVGGNFFVQNLGDFGSYSLNGGSLSVNGQLHADQGTFTWTAGTITRSIPGLIDILGSIVANPNTILGLDGTDQATKTFLIDGDLDIRSGITLDLANYVLPSGPAVGSFQLGYVGSIQGKFDLQNTFLTSLGVPLGVSRISETDAETPGFDLENHYWVAEAGSLVSLSYNIIVPEPATFVTLLGGLGVLVGLNRFRRRGAMV